MKDKLVKYNRKANYYIMRKAFLAFGLFVAVSVAVAVPVSVSIANGSRAAQAQETGDSSDSGSSTLEEYYEEQ